jgi:hypothetical protein
MKRTLTALAIAALAAGPLAAKDKPAAPPPLYQAVVDCRAIADSAERLACFDRTVGAMAQASEAKDLVVVDRETMRETRKGLFGFSLPKLKLFGGGNEDEKDIVREIESTITGIRTAKDGFPVYTIADGARWKQTDGRNLFPKVGQKIKIKAASLGSYMASIDGRAGVRVMRLPD